MVAVPNAMRIARPVKVQDLVVDAPLESSLIQEPVVHATLPAQSVKVQQPLVRNVGVESFFNNPPVPRAPVPARNVLDQEKIVGVKMENSSMWIPVPHAPPLAQSVKI